MYRVTTKIWVTLGIAFYQFYGKPKSTQDQKYKHKNVRALPLAVDEADILCKAAYSGERFGGGYKSHTEMVEILAGSWGQ
jgi:hypothetical protein